MDYYKNTIINVCESKVKDESRKAAGNVIDLLTMREFSHDELNDILNYVRTEWFLYRHLTPDYYYFFFHSLLTIVW